MALLSKDFIVKSGLIVQGTTNPVSTSTGNTGTLQVNGGAAFAKDILIGSSATVYGPSVLKSTLNIGGDFNVNNNFSIESGSGNFHSTGTMVVDGVSTVSNIVIDGNEGITGLNAGYDLTFKAATGDDTLVGSDAAATLFFDGALYSGPGSYAEVTVNGTDGVRFQTNDGSNLNQLVFDYDGILKLTNYNNDTAAAALEIKGVSNGGINLSDTGDAADSFPALNVSAGGAYINKDLKVDGTTNGTSSGGALFVASGGAYINNDVYVDSSTTASNAAAALFLASGGAYINQDLQIDSTTNGGTAGDGALRVSAGGAYIDQDVYVGGSSTNAATTSSASLHVGQGGIYVANNVLIDGTTAGTSSGGTLSVPNGGARFGLSVRIEDTNDGDATDPALNLSAGGLYVNKKAIIDSTQTATDAGDGAVQVAGGVYIGDNLIVKSTAADTGTNTSNALYVAGGAWIDKTLVVAGDTTFGGSVTFNGTATYVYSTNTVYTDNLINMHTPNGGDLNNHAWGVDDGKDIGFVFHYYKGSDKNAFLGFANGSTYLEWFSDGTENVNGTFTGTTYGTFKTGAIELVNTTSATNTTTGALIVAGGIGVAGDIYLQDEIGTHNKLHGTATQADNLNKGSAGQIPIQTAAGTTAFLPAGTADNQVLTWVSAGSTATWASASGTSVGRATTATNVDGPQWSVLYQKDVGLTTATSDLQYNADDETFKVKRVTIWSTATDAPGNANIQVAADSGLGVELFSDDYAQLNYNNVAYIYVNGTDGAVMETGTGDYTLTLDTSGNAVLDGGGYLQAPTVRADNLTNGRVVISDANHELTDDDGLTYDSGTDTLTVGGSIEISGSGGDITMTGGDITGVDQITIDGSEGGYSNNSSDAALMLPNGGIYSKKSIYIDSSHDYDDGDDAAALNLPNGGAVIGLNLGLGDNLIFTSTTGQVQFDSNANLREEDSVALGSGRRDLVLDAEAQVIIKTDEADNVWVYGVDGTLELPNGTKVYDDTGKFYVDSLRDDSTATTLVVYNSDTKELTRTTTFNNTLTVNHSVIIKGTEASSTNTTATGALQVVGGVGIAGGLYVDQNAYVNADLYVQGTLYVQGNSLDGVDQITGSTGTFVNVTSTGTIFANIVTATSIETATLLVDGTEGGYGYPDAALNVPNGGAYFGRMVWIENDYPSLANTSTYVSFNTQGGASIQKDLYVGTTATFNDSVYIANDIYLGGKKLSSTSSEFTNIVSTGTARFNNVDITGTFTATSLTITSTDNNVDAYGFDLDETSQSLGVRGAIKALGDIAAGGVIYAGMNDGGDVGRESPDGKPIDGVFIVNSMQSGGSYTGLNGSWTEVIDSWDNETYTSAKYMIQLTDTGGKVHTQELMVIHDGTDVYMSEYGIITTQGELGTFSGGFTGTNVVISFTPNYSTSAMNIQVVRQSIITDLENYC
jgi:hypothetical protein